MNTSKIINAIEVTVTSAFALAAIAIICVITYTIMDDVFNHDYNEAKEAAYCAAYYAGPATSDEGDLRCGM